MPEADLVVIEALLDDVLDEMLISESIDEAIRVLRGENQGDDRPGQVEKELAAVTREHQSLMKAIQSLERVSGLLEALRLIDRRRQCLEAERVSFASPTALSASRATDDGRSRRRWRELLALLS